MRKFIIMLGGFVIGAMLLMADARPSQAYIYYPWCAHYAGRLGVGAPSCGFTTWAQCMATASPQGTCEMNPYTDYKPAAAPRTKRRKAG